MKSAILFGCMVFAACGTEVGDRSSLEPVEVTATPEVSPTASVTPSATPSPTATPVPTKEPPTPEATVSATPVPTVDVSPTPSATASATPAPTASPTPTATPEPTVPPCVRADGPLEGVSDRDQDGWSDACDNCPDTDNGDQVDDDGDRVGNACEFECTADEHCGGGKICLAQVCRTVGVSIVFTVDHPAHIGVCAPEWNGDTDVMRMTANEPMSATFATCITWWPADGNWWDIGDDERMATALAFGCGCIGADMSSYQCSLNCHGVVECNPRPQQFECDTPR